MVCQTLLANLLMDAFIEPLNDCIFNFADTLQVREVLLKFIAIRRHAFQSVIVANVFLVWQLLEEDRLPLNSAWV